MYAKWYDSVSVIHRTLIISWFRKRGRGADPGFGQGGGPGPEAESCRRSEAESRERIEQFAAGVQGPLKLKLLGF